jgi:hypothetical protein
MSLCLSQSEVFEITGYKRGADQLRALKVRGIPAARRPDGSVSVLRAQLAMLAAPTAKSEPSLESGSQEKPEPQVRPINGTHAKKR